MDHHYILNLRYPLDSLIFIAWMLSFVLWRKFLALEPCDLSSPSLVQIHGSLLLTLFWPLLLHMPLIDHLYDRPSIFESRSWYFSIASKLLVVKIVVAFLMDLVIRHNDDPEEWKINRLFEHATICRRINGTYDFEYCIDPMEPPRCDSISARRPWTILEIILALIIVEFVVFLLIYSIVRWKSRRRRRRRGCLLFEPQRTHPLSVWWHRLDLNDRDTWHDHDELIAFFIDYADDCAVTPDRWLRTFLAMTLQVIDLNTTSDKENIDRLIYSMIIFDCLRCTSDNGLYLVITSEFLGKCRLIKISSTIPLNDWNRTAAIRAYVQDELVMCMFEDEDDRRTKFLLYNLKDDSKRKFDILGGMGFDGGRLWCLKDDGRDMGDDINKEASYVRIIYRGIPTDQVGIGYSIRQCLLEITFDDSGQVVVKRLQEITYESKWRLTKHYRLIRTSRGEVGIIGELVDSNVTTGDNDDGARWATCVMYSPETRKLSATGDYEKYLEIDPALRQYFDRNLNENESMRRNNFRSMRRIKGEFLCPQMLTNARAIDIQDDGSIRSIDFRPRSLKWLSLKKLFDAYGKNLGKFGEEHWVKLTGVKLDEHFWD